ncbi:unnamed protein product [Durusdinium trenchii]|uniref:Uncharacterized protein n=1 Tax=Durusdinium trenchii TaxID=1381693 RepID=A0ABP0M6V6_9DINO
MCSLGSSWAALRRKILREMAEGSIPSRDCELGKACLESQYISIQTCQPKRLLNRPPSFAFFIVAAKKRTKGAPPSHAAHTTVLAGKWEPERMVVHGRSQLGRPPFHGATLGTSG